MKTYWFLVFVILVPTCFADEATAPQSARPIPVSEALEIPNQIVEVTKARIEVGEYRGIIIGVVDPTGKRVFSMGKVDTLGRLPTADTVLEIGSVTKVFTGTLLASFVETQNAQLNNTLNQLLRPSNKSLANGDLIRLAELATHTSGLPR